MAVPVRSDWIIDRTEATSRHGMVAAKTPQAADAGADVLARGGNAIDAVVTTALVAGVVEPWMNGIGGGGYLIAHIPERDEAISIEFPMVSPRGANETMFPLAGTGRISGALFAWPAVEGNANIVGHRAVAVPGTVAGLALALERYGTISWADALAPAIRAAEEGIRVTWHTTLEVARDLANLNRFPATAAIFCDAAGDPPFTLDELNPALIRQLDLAQTLRTLAQDGPRAFYEGPIAAAIVEHLQANGAPFDSADFARYQATIAEPLCSSYSGHEIFTIGKGTGGTTLTQSIRLLAELDLARHGHNAPEALHLMAQAFRLAFADRYTYLADPDQVQVPLDALLSADYLDERRESIGSDRPRPVAAGGKSRLGVTHDLASSVPEYTAGGCTTHLGAIDRHGLAVSLTQTLLSVWGSRVVVPGTGVLLNNGMMWFDPEPGRPNSVGGGKRPLSNMAPAVVTRDGRAVASLGASGGRRIMNCVAQLAFDLIDHGMSMQQAVSAPRIDASTPDLLVDRRIPAETQATLSALGHHVVTLDDRLFLGGFASPACIQAAADGSFRGGVDPNYYPATAVGVSE